MAAGYERFLTLSIGVRASPEPVVIKLLYRYRDALNFATNKLIIMGYSRIERWIDWQAEKHGVPYVKVDPNGTSSECPICDYKGLEEIGYRRLRCPRCGFEADRDVIGKLNVRKRGLRKLGIKFSGRALTPQMTDVAPNR